MNFLVVGERESGKSTLIYQMFKNYDCGGIVCLPAFENGELVGKDAVDMGAFTSTVFCRIKKKADFDGLSVGRYILHPEGIDFCIQAIRNSTDKTICIIDEIGPLEMEENGLYDITHEVLKGDKNCVILLRESLIATFFTKFPYHFTVLPFS